MVFYNFSIIKDFFNEYAKLYVEICTLDLADEN